MKNFLPLFLISSLFGIFGGYLFVSLNGFGYGETFQEAVISVPVPATSSSDSLERLVNKLSVSFVGIQAFRNNEVIRQGSGLVVSSDGLIMTTADLYASDVPVYQIFYEDKILKGTVEAKDARLNLMILKTSESASNIVEFNVSEEYQSGQELVLLGKIFALSKPVTASQKAMVSYATDKTVVLDTEINKYIYGFGAVDRDGRIRGLTYIREGRVNLITSEVMDNFLKTYLSKKQ